MSITDHKRIDNSDTCIYCLECWPCDTARILRDAADLIRAEGDPGSYEYVGGYEWAANLIDPDVTR